MRSATSASGRAPRSRPHAARACSRRTSRKNIPSSSPPSTARCCAKDSGPGKRTTVQRYSTPTCRPVFCFPVFYWCDAVTLLPSHCSPVTRFHYPLSTVHCPLSTVHCPLSTVHCPLSTAPLFHCSIVPLFHCPLSNEPSCPPPSVMFTSTR